MNTTEKNSVRVDIFKESGKWYDTINIKMKEYNYNRSVLIHDSFEEALYENIKNSYKGMWAVCLHPYHELSFPLMIKIE